MVILSMAAFATEINSCNKGHLTHKLKNIFYVAFYKKELLTPAPKTAEYVVYNYALYATSLSILLLVDI